MTDDVRTDDLRVSATGVVRRRKSHGRGAKQRRDARRREAYLARQRPAAPPAPSVVHEFTITPPARPRPAE